VQELLVVEKVVKVVEVVEVMGGLATTKSEDTGEGWVLQDGGQ